MEKLIRRIDLRAARGEDAKRAAIYSPTTQPGSHGLESSRLAAKKRGLQEDDADQFAMAEAEEAAEAVSDFEVELVAEAGTIRRNSFKLDPIKCPFGTKIDLKYC